MNSHGNFLIYISGIRSSKTNHYRMSTNQLLKNISLKNVLEIHPTEKLYQSLATSLLVENLNNVQKIKTLANYSFARV